MPVRRAVASLTGLFGRSRAQGDECLDLPLVSDDQNFAETAHGFHLEFPCHVNKEVVVSAVLQKNVGNVSVICKVYNGDYKTVYDVFVTHDGNLFTQHLWSRRYSDLRLAAKTDPVFGQFPSRSLFSNHSLDFLSERTKLLARYFAVLLSNRSPAESETILKKFRLVDPKIGNDRIF